LLLGSSGELPYAFAQSRTLLTIALLVFVTFLSIVAVIWILDALSVAPSVRSRLSTPLLALSESSLPQAGLGPLDGFVFKWNGLG
jgi:hypothetical protein